MRTSAMTACLLLLGALPCTSQMHVRSDREAPKSVSDFVQGFYSWYVPEALKTQETPAWNVALKYRRRAFSPALFRALKEDSNAQANVNGEVVGLDFDPFLSTQDPCERYEVGMVTPKDETYWVDIYGVCSGKRNEKPDVIAELAHQGDSWVFINFRYPAVGRDLLSTAKALREERRKSSHGDRRD